MSQLLEPSDFDCPLTGGGTKTFVLSKFPAVAGREIIAKYPMSGLPKLGDYAVNEETMFKLMSFVGVRIEGRDEPLRLSTRALVENHCPDWECLARIEVEMLKRNCSFFRDGRTSTFLTGIARQAQAWISKTLMASSAQSSKAGKPPFTN